MQVGGAALAMFTAFAAGLPPEYAASATAGVNLAQSILTMIFKTYFTDTVTPSSVGK